jgi:hypothetical protein
MVKDELRAIATRDKFWTSTRSINSLSPVKLSIRTQLLHHTAPELIVRGAGWTWFPTNGHFEEDLATVAHLLSLTDRFHPRWTGGCQIDAGFSDHIGYGLIRVAQLTESWWRTWTPVLSRTLLFECEDGE